MPTLAHTLHRTRASAALITGALLLGLGSPAYAHDSLMSSTPENGSSTTEAPRSLELTYSGDIMPLDGANQINVVDADGNSVTDGSPEINGKTVTQRLIDGGAEDDTYTVTWRVVSSDGHPIQGTFTYDVGAGKENTGTPTAESTAPAQQTAAPLTSATSGLVNGAKIGIALLGALAIVGGAIVVLTKNKKK